jgi:hypothetical protein
MKIDWSICIGLKASPVAEVALPACQIVHSNSGGGSFRESYDRKIAGTPPGGVPLYIAVTALLHFSLVYNDLEGSSYVFVRFSRVS